MAEPAHNRDRLKAAIGVAAFHAMLGYVLVTSFGYRPGEAVRDRLEAFDVTELVPPTVEPEPASRVSPEPEGAAAPPNLKSKAAPVVVPQPKVRIETPPPVRAAETAGTGPDRTAGAADVAGPGTGAGGEGSGTGAGGRGTGGGSGGSPARRISGRLNNDDYPRAALRAGAEGTVYVRYTVGADGRVSGCTVTRSSGHAELDAVTCRLIERRYRYRPARDASGRPVRDTVRRTYDWILPFRRGEAQPPAGP